MIKIYIKIAWRNLVRNRVSSIINISGLAIGLACVLLIGMYIKDELSYDRFFKDSARIFRVNLDGKMGNEQFLVGHTPPPAGAALLNNFPEIETYTRILKPFDEVIHYESKGQKSSFTEKSLLAVDSNFLTFFNYPLVAGDPKTCLKGVNSLVLTETAAKKYFGSEPAIGKTFTFDDYTTPFIITAVLKDLPKQSSLQFQILQPTASVGAVKYFNWSWVWLQMGTYVKLKPNTPTDKESIANLERKFPAMVATQAPTAFKRIGQPWEEFKRKGGKWDLKLQPITDLHLYSADVGTRYFEVSNIKNIYIFSAIAVFIMLLACVNFMNLSTAQSAKRAKEVGIRKVLGSLRKQLIRQFMVEAMLYSLFAAVVAVIIVLLVLPAFNQLSDKMLSATVFLDVKTWIGILALVILTGFFAGSYPAFFITAFKPVAILKGSGLLKGNGSGFLTRNILVVFQFFVSTVLIICTIVVYKQLFFNQTKDLGFSRENMVILPNVGRLGTGEETLRQELLKLPQVVNASISTGLPAENSFGDTYIPETNTKNVNGVENNIMLSSYMVDDAFVPTLKLKVISGRAFSKQFTDSASVILNETAVKQIGWKNPIGRTITYPGNNNQKFTVVGVVQDFNSESFHSIISPFALFYTTSKTYFIKASYLTVRIKPGNYPQTIGAIQNTLKKIAPDMPFDYSFMDAEFDLLYKADQTMGKVFSVFTVLSLTVACLGLLGLAIYTAERRMKEIGIRKVLGASVKNLVGMLSMDFVKLIVIASLIAFPIAWYAMNKWLQDFAFKTELSWWVFALAAGVTMLIALVTISFQSIKAAVSNPVDSLRSE